MTNAMNDKKTWMGRRTKYTSKLKYYYFTPPDYAAVPTSLPTLGQGPDAAEHIMETALGGPRSGEMVLNASRLQETKT